MKRRLILAWLVLGLFSCFARTEEKVFKSGLRVIFPDYNGRSAIASAVILVRAGEADGPPYLATLTNRMLLGGTEIRDRQQINLDVESVTGRINAMTSLTLSALTVQAPAESFLPCFAILCECATQAAFDSSEAVRMASFPDEDSMSDNLFFSRKGVWADAPLRARLFSGSPFARDFQKNKTLLYARSQMVSFYDSRYRPENMVISVAGKVDRAKVIKTIQSFWKTGRSQAKEKGPVPSKERFDSAETAVSKQQILKWGKPADQVWIGFHAPAFCSRGYMEMAVLEAALADGRAGYFSNRVFTEKQDDITVQSYYQSEPELGYFVLQARAPAGKGDEVKRTILDEIEKIKKQGLPEKCFELGVRKARARAAILSQSNLLNASFAAMAAAGGNAAVTLIESNKSLSRMTPGEVHQAARTYLVRPAVVLVPAPPVWSGR